MKAAVAIGAACGLALGLGGVVTGERLRMDAGPPGWRLDHPDVPVRLARLAGPPRLPGQGWPLDSHGLLTRDLPGVDRSDGQAVEVLAELPVGGQLELRLGQADRGVALVLSRVGEGLAAVATTDADRTAPVGPGQPRRWLDCEGALAVPGEGPVAVSLAVEAGVATARVGDSSTRCRMTRGGGPAASGRVGLRAGLRRVGIHAIAAAGQPAQQAPGPAWPLRLLGALLGGGLGAGVVLLGARRGLRPGLLALAMLPWLLVPWLAGSDLAAGLQAARISADQPVAWALALPLGLSAALLLALLQARLVRGGGKPDAASLPGTRALLLVLGAALGLPALVALGLPGLLVVVIGVALAFVLPLVLSRLGPAADRATAGALGIALLAGLAAWAADPHFGVAVPLAQGAALLLALLVWANARAAEVRGFNLLSLALFVGALSFAEQALTWTATGMSLVGVSSRAAPAGSPGADPATPAPGAADDLGTAFRSFEALDNVREFQRYPIQDYPVKPPPRAAPVRIAALGSSSTAGAYQNDDVDEFWPADLDRLLGPDVQVVNQGVGGWTSLHVRRYVETRPEVLDADILVLYLGHNDLLTESPRPYRQLYAAWKAGGSASTVVSDVLGDIRLYQLLRFSLQALTGVGVGPAVPVDDAADNLATIADLQQQRGGKVLLVSEGLAPDPSVMQPYVDLMQELARTRGDHVAFLDGGALLGDPSRSGLFLDDCHLTRQGHELLAAGIAGALKDQGWVQ